MQKYDLNNYGTVNLDSRLMSRLLTQYRSYLIHIRIHNRTGRYAIQSTSTRYQICHA